MPLFEDVHDHLVLPEEVVQQIAASAARGERDKFGVLQHQLYYNASGRVVCILDAPDADAVLAHHQELGVECGAVHEVKSM